MDIEELKKRLKEINRENIEFSKHAELQLFGRFGSKEEVIGFILTPDKLIDFEEQNGKYKLYFEISNSRTMILPIVFEGKGLKVLTYIMRYRSWKKELKRGYLKKWKK